MKFQLSKCCYCINLRFGCFLVVFFDIFMHAVHIEFGNHEVFKVLKPFIYVTHFVGCLMLFYSAAVVSLLTLVYLTTDVLKFIFFVLSAYGWMNRQNTIFTLCIHVINILFSVYFWLVAYSYFRQCKDNSIETRGTSTVN
ncbi:uncharacterized protein LOC111598437 isoform X2 [Drosophila hydei]|uniref:Uncharacterized protein LOC111598437 isoform X2 n=1 Tax=Drosophila hydei TaxID=7224 RepID=A0A6J1LR88_DROHY|nr:uncharacterized protein LOC111598437 isoform X2 [Drosophila hydei]